MQTIQAQTVYENDEFEFEYGLNPKLIHRPATSDRGEPVYFYGLFKTQNGGYGYSCMSKEDMDKISEMDKKESSFFSHYDTSIVEMIAGLHQ